MGQISVSAATSVPVEPPSTPAVYASTNQATTNQATTDRTLNRAVSAAVGKLNDSSYAGEGREVTFSVDPATKQPVVKVIDTDTKEVIRQLPPEYVLQLAADDSGDGRDSG